MMLMLNVAIVIVSSIVVLGLVAAWRDRWVCHWCFRQNWPGRHVCWNCELARKVEV